MCCRSYVKSPYCMKEFIVAVSAPSESSLFGFSQTKTDRYLFAQQTNNKLLVVVCENIGKITAVDPKDFPHASNALAHFGSLTRPPPNRVLCN